MGFDIRSAFMRLVGWRESPAEAHFVAELALWAATSDRSASTTTRSSTSR